MKKIVLLTLVVSILSCSFNFNSSPEYNSGIVYNADYYGTQDNTLYQTDNFATYYFYNLNTHFGYNKHGSCPYIAIQMLLSYKVTFHKGQIGVSLFLLVSY